jgi:serine/threonine protein kinase
MQFKTNVGAEVQKYLERYDDASNIVKPHGKTILRLDWTGINPDYEVIGEGTYSIVHKLKLLDDPNTFYALKFLDPNMMKDNSGEERYKRAAMDICFEGKILERLDHQNIVSLRGIPNGSVKDNVNDESFPYFLLLDYLPLTLDHVLQQKRKSTKERLFRTRSKVVKRLEQIAVGIVSAMEYMHERGCKLIIFILG